MSKISELKRQIIEFEKKTQELQKELELEKQKTEIEYPFCLKGECWQLRIDGLVSEDWWSHSGYDQNCYQQGNMFTTQQEAIKERDRRNLLTRFRQFRDKCNGDWKPDFEDCVQCKYSCYYDYHSKTFECYDCGEGDNFTLFGCFKHEPDAERAIELFGDEIKRLWLEE